MWRRSCAEVCRAHKISLDSEIVASKSNPTDTRNTKGARIPCSIKEALLNLLLGCCRVIPLGLHLSTPICHQHVGWNYIISAGVRTEKSKTHNFWVLHQVMVIDSVASFEYIAKPLHIRLLHKSHPQPVKIHVLIFVLIMRQRSQAFFEPKPRFGGSRNTHTPPITWPPHNLILTSCLSKSGLFSLPRSKRYII